MKMKTKLLLLALGLAVLSGCSNIKDDVSETGTLEIKCGLNTAVTLKSTAAANPNDFIVKIKDGQDAVVKEFDPVSSAPDQVELMAGTYTVEAYSEEFTAPAFDTPVYGGSVVVDVVPDQNKEAIINCTQTNAGVKFLWTDEFKAAFSSFVAKVKVADKALDFPETETRIGYFPAGDITIDITLGETPNEATYTKTFTLNAREVVTIKPVASDAGSGTLTVAITIDTDVTEREEIFVIGTGGGGTSSPVGELTEDWSDGTDLGDASINGWTVFDRDNGADRAWVTKVYNAEKYAQMSGYGGTASEYESWLISPALDLDAATYKTLKFETAKAFWGASTTLEVFIMDGTDPNTANKQALSAVLAKEADANHAWIPSGTIDLSSYSGTQYIAFKYVGAATTFRMDNFHFGFNPDGSGDTGGDTGGSAGSEILVEDFATASAGTAVDASGTLWDGGVNFTAIDRVYEAAGSVKLGSSSSAGSMVSKALDLTGNGGAFTVSFKAKGWFSEDINLIIEVDGVEKTATFTSTGKAGDMVDASVGFTGGKANSVITVKTTTREYNGNTVPQRVFIDDFKVTQ